ncbi:MAG TPA: serine hydrolase [Thermoanaerobaculia bacterium]|nr:serine hydrolase [Thermoanaerobaculia bacterium]
MARSLSAALLLSIIAASAQADFRDLVAIPVDQQLETRLARIAKDAMEANSALTDGNLSLTVVDISDPSSPRRASFAPEITYHPASVVKLFYMAAAFELAERGSPTPLVLNDPLHEAMEDMIVDSSNDATSYMIDRMSGTTSGPEMSGTEWKRWVERRNVVNRWLHAMGYDVNANGKTWCDGIYGREKQLLGADRENRNRVTSEAVAAMALWIARRRAVSEAASDRMLTLMHRVAGGDGDGGQVKGFAGESLPEGSKLWSKAGWTSEVRHDVMIVELEDGTRYVAGILTRGVSDDLRMLPRISEAIANAMSEPHQ